MIISVSTILQIWFSCLMLHLSVIRVMQDVIEGLWLHVTEDRLQADHSKKITFKKLYTENQGDNSSNASK